MNKPATKQRGGLIVGSGNLQDSHLVFKVIIGSLTTCFGHWKLMQLDLAGHSVRYLIKDVLSALGSSWLLFRLKSM